MTTNDPPYVWISHPQIQPPRIENIFGKKKLFVTDMYYVVKAIMVASVLNM